MTRTETVDVLVASENRMFRECLGEHISRESVFRVTGMIAGATELRGELRKRPPRVLVFDSDGIGGISETLVARSRAQWPDVRILVLIPRIDDHLVARLLQHGAAGVIPRSESLPTLLRAIEIVAAGKTWAGRNAIGRAVTNLQRQERRSTAALTPREGQLLTLLGDGYRNKELASLLQIKEQTVKVHLHSLFRKLNVRTRVEAALKANDLS